MAESSGAQASGDSGDVYKGIPTVAYIENMEAYLRDNGGAWEAVIQRLESTHQKYKMIEGSLFARRQRLRAKLPDLKQSLQLVKVLEEKRAGGEETGSRFMLSEQAYASAVIPPSDSVCLWLGANVMLEYSLQEAAKLLQKNIAGAESTINELTHQLDFLKDQTTTTEVNIARVYNHGVALRKLEQTAAAAANAVTAPPAS